MLFVAFIKRLQSFCTKKCIKILNDPILSVILLFTVDIAESTISLGRNMLNLQKLWCEQQQRKRNSVFLLRLLLTRKNVLKCMVVKLR